MNPYLLIVLVCLWTLSLSLVARHYKRQVKQLSSTCALLAWQREEALQRGHNRSYIVSLYEDWKRKCAINDDALDQNLVGLLSGRIPTPLPKDGVDA